MRALMRENPLGGENAAIKLIRLTSKALRLTII